MAAEMAAADAGAPNLNLSQEEKRLYGQLFRQADEDQAGVVTGERAVRFFEKTRLPSPVLGEIWQIADRENRGFLTPAGFGVALRLIGHAQAGRATTPNIALQSAPLPRFDGFNPTPAPLSQQTTGSQPIQAQGTGSGLIRIPPLTPEKVGQYAGLFERQSLQNGTLLPGDSAKSIFEKAGLPNEVLGRIWQLADTEQRGALVQTEFVIAMHLLTSMKTGALRGLPTILPAALYEAATRRAGSSGGRPQSPQATGSAPISAIPRQLSGQAGYQSPMRTGTGLSVGPGQMRSPLAQQSTGGDAWLITPPDKARFDSLYDTLDKTNKGYVTGGEVVPFFSQSSLPEDTLASIWDLADIRSQGQLSRDEFAVAMYLIRQARSKSGASGIVPSSLPPNLIPPSLRGQVQPTTQPDPFDGPAPQQAPPVTKPASALDDLFGLDSATTPTTSSSQKPSGPGAPTDPFSSSSSPISPNSPAKSGSRTNSFAPFVPSSTFGRGLTTHATGDSAASGGNQTRPGQQQLGAVSDDLLGDNDESSKGLNNDTVELAHLSNQIGTLSKQMQDVQGDRGLTQNQINQTAAQKKNFEERLAQLRGLYEAQANDVRQLREQLSASQSETQKLQMEVVKVDGSHKELLAQHQTLTSALQADQVENAGLKEKIRSTNAEIAALKPQIEKLKADTRQQKGLVAINKKQLSTNEGERETLQTEHADLAKEHQDLQQQQQQQEASQSPIRSKSVAAQVASPAPSANSANNPFFKRTGSTDLMGSFASPGGAGAGANSSNDKSFDDIFGPSSTAAATAATSPPATSFKPQLTGNSATDSSPYTTPTTSSPAVSRQITGANQAHLPPSFSRQVTGPEQAPPPPSVSRQVTSSFLPLGGVTESLSSSRHVSPPMSRAGDESAFGEPPVAAKVASAIARAADEAPGASTTSDDRSGGQDVSTSSPFDAPSTSNAAANTSVFPPVDQAKAKDDFDSAFASFKAAGSSNNSKAAEHTPDSSVKGVSAFNTEFPPISEIEKDEYSSSDDDDVDNHGFDDDFAPSSPATKPRSQSNAKTVTQDEAAPHVSSQADAPKPAPVPAAASVASATRRELQSTDSDDFFKTRALPGAFPTSSYQVPTLANKAAVESPTVSKQSSAFDDLDDDFADLEDAKEESGADDDFPSTTSRHGHTGGGGGSGDDFNSIFDSSPAGPSMQSTFTPEQHSMGGGGAASTQASQPFGTDSGYDFASVSNTSAAGAGSSSAGDSNGGNGSKSNAQPEGHDWDAIFASLDDAPPAASGTSPGGGPGASSSTVNALTGATAAASATHSGAADVGGQGERPAPLGRALTEDGLHDDPILQELTSMGYSRKAALGALEKYDYNLGKAANHLASSS